MAYGQTGLEHGGKMGVISRLAPRVHGMARFAARVLNLGESLNGKGTSRQGMNSDRISARLRPDNKLYPGSHAINCSRQEQLDKDLFASEGNTTSMNKVQSRNRACFGAKSNWDVFLLLRPPQLLIPRIGSQGADIDVARIQDRPPPIPQNKPQLITDPSILNRQ